jgi:ABC-type transport system involved in multi-copper enzyme maturation permease subunit
MLCLQREFPTELFSEPKEIAALALICGAGTIGSQLSDGTLSLVLSRPITISQYAASKWFAISVAAIVVSSLQLLSELLVALCRTPAAVDVSTLAANLIERILFCIGFGAVLTFLSALVSGGKDLGLYLLAQLTLQLLALASSINARSVPEGIARFAVQVFGPVAKWLAATLQLILNPYVEVSSVLNGMAISSSSIFSYLAVITVFLSLAIFCLNRRELPYGAD